MSNYKLATYRTPQGPRAGMVVGDMVFDVAAATGRPTYVTTLDVLRDWDRAHHALEDAAAALPAGGVKTEGRPLSGTKLLAPVQHPSGIFCAGANFTDHMMEMAKVQNLAPEPDPHSVGLKPWHFIKAPHCLAPPNSTVKLPPYSTMVDWEAELTAVIGRPAKNVAIENALHHVAGYTIGNDLSARDLTKRTPVPDSSPFKYDWLGQKNFDDGSDIGDGAERHVMQHAQQIRLRHFAGPESPRAQFPVDRDQRDQHEADRGEMAEAGKVVGPVRIHQRVDIGQFVAALMMIDDDHRHPQPSRASASGSKLVVPQSTVTSSVAPLPASMLDSASTLGP